APAPSVAARRPNVHVQVGRRSRGRCLSWIRVVTSRGVTPRQHRRALAATVAAGAAVLALAPGASAAFKPLFTATSAGDVVPLSYSQAASNDGAASLAFYAPSGSTLGPATKAGTVVGTATGNAIAADIRNSTMPLDGTIRVASPTAPLAAGAAT